MNVITNTTPRKPVILSPPLRLNSELVVPFVGQAMRLDEPENDDREHGDQLKAVFISAFQVVVHAIENMLRVILLERNS